MLDRIGLQVDVQAVAAADLVLPPPWEGSAEVARRVAAARTVAKLARSEEVRRIHVAEALSYWRQAPRS